MERNFYDNDFEEFLKKKADQYKMYPSERVWDNIYSSLHNRRRWLAFGFTVVFLASALFIGRQVTVMNYSRMVAQIDKNPQSLLESNNTTARNLRQYIPTASASLVKSNSSTNTSSLLNSNTIPAANNSAAAGQQVYTTIPVHTDAVVPVTENNMATTLPAATLTAEGQPLVIENNLLPANTDETVITRNLNTALPPLAKQQGLHKSITAKDLTLQEPAKISAIQNDNAAYKQAKSPRLFVQFYGSPIISYRRLSNDPQPATFGSQSSSAVYGDNINKYVRHQPAPGFEAGTKVLYKLSNTLSVYVGAQLNYSRYYIDAYKYSVEKASIALSSSSRDTLSGYTDIRNFSGYSPEQLQNQYWQISVPVGVEIKLLGNRKLQFNVAGGIQPTFLVNNNTYLISSDYKNYIQSPDLARSFNIHTNFEAFVSYKTGSIKWQLGPQFRSQLLSSYSNQYRVREYLTEFGLKFGVTKTIR